MWLDWKILCSLIRCSVIKAYMLKSGQKLYDLNWTRARQEEAGWKIWHEEWFPQLDIPYKPMNTLYVATNQEQLGRLERMWEAGHRLCGLFADMEKVDRKFILGKEPNINKDVITGLWSTTPPQDCGLSLGFGYERSPCSAF